MKDEVKEEKFNQLVLIITSTPPPASHKRPNVRHDFLAYFLNGLS